ncbi:hypothetical protein ACFP2T_27425 [Plantactinospora solaniradicis]|uniref:Integral membrane protein n=1 Tax=Plantactinospora solaniradicis TaxID=1723736 RepID=A0ABW1KE30_9ACTN
MSGPLERRYRLLLTAFPARHRRLYHEEMLGVLLDRAEPGQRRPTMAEVADLLTAAVGVRLRALRAAATDDRWRTAAAVTATIAAVLLASLGLRTVAYNFGMQTLVTSIVPGAEFEPWSAPDVLRDLVWLPVVIAALLGWRTGAAAIASLVTVAEAVVLIDRYRMFPTDLLYGLRPLALGFLASVGFAMSVRHRPVSKLLGRRRTGALLLAGLLVIGTGIANLLQVKIVPLPGREGSYSESAVRSMFGPQYPHINPSVAVLYLAALALLLIVLARLAGPVRRRIVAVALPVVVLYLVVEHSFLGYRMAAYHVSPPLPLDAGQWLRLALPPVGLLVLCVALVHWYEGRRRPDPIRY